MTAVSPGQVARFQGNSYYKSDEDYLWALADVLKDGYKAITTPASSCSSIAQTWPPLERAVPVLTLAEFRKVVDLHIEILNAAPKDIPPERMRLHSAGAITRVRTIMTFHYGRSLSQCSRHAPRPSPLRAPTPSRARMDRLRGGETA